MLRLIAQLLWRRPPRPGEWTPRERHDGRLAGYLVSANRKTIDTRWQDLGSALRRLLWRLLAIALACGVLWVLWESSRALSIF